MEIPKETVFHLLRPNLLLNRNWNTTLEGTRNEKLLILQKESLVAQYLMPNHLLNMYGAPIKVIMLLEKSEPELGRAINTKRVG